MISLENVSFSYSKERGAILNNISLTINPQERVGIVGENGCGKSTIVKLILGILTPDQGSVKIFQKHADWLTNYATVGYLGDPSHKPGSLGLPSGLTVKQVLSYQEELFKSQLNIDLDQNIITELELDHLYNQKIESLSTGQRKRLMIGMSFRKPLDLIIADEPFDGLDINIKEKVDLYMKKAIEDGLSILYISHNIIEIDRYTSKVFQLKKRKLVELQRRKFEMQVGDSQSTSRKKVMKEGEILGFLESEIKKPSETPFKLTITAL